MNKNESYAGKVAFVTGAANGFGRATARAFASKGASVVVADVSARGSQETARMIGALGQRALAATLAWLCSDAAAFVIGHAMTVDGGQTV